jgi:hypothetical protein
MAENDPYLDEDPNREASYEEDARLTVEHLLANVEFDEIRGVISLMSGTDHRFNDVREEFTSLEEVQRMLTEKAEAEWINTVPWDKGPVFEPNVEGMVERLLEEKKIFEFFYPKPPYTGEELFSAKQLLIPAASMVARIDLENINDELFRYFAAHPERMRDMPPRKFEELMAELFKAKGYDVELTPKTKDGGFDIRAYTRSDIGSLLTLIECKRYGEEQKVQVGVVRELHGVVDDQRANRGIIATTSTFTRGAKAFRDKHEYRMHLMDITNIQDWLKTLKVRP